MSAVFTPSRAKLTVEQFHRIGESGILGAEARLELIEGEMIQMAPIGSRHAWTVDRIANTLRELAGSMAWVSTQNPVRLSRYTEPQPDVMLLRRKPDGYRDALPEAEDVLLLVEVSDTTLEYDRGTKLPLYARHGIQEVWIVDLSAARVEIYREPADDGYRVRFERSAGEAASPSALPEVSLEIQSVLTA